jgi:hypothetical protein
MQQIVIPCTLITMMHFTFAHDQHNITKASQGREARATAARQGLDEKTKNILTRFFDVLGSFFAILQDPKDPVRVTSNITNMLAGAVNIVAEGIKSGELSLDANDEEIQAYAQRVRKKIEHILNA